MIQTDNGTIASFLPLARMFQAETDGFGLFVALHISAPLTNSHAFQRHTPSCAPVFVVKAGFFAFSGARSPFAPST
jgi:hypothetical protein